MQIPIKKTEVYFLKSSFYIQLLAVHFFFPSLKFSCCLLCATDSHQTTPTLHLNMDNLPRTQSPAASGPPSGSQRKPQNKPSAKKKSKPRALNGGNSDAGGKRKKETKDPRFSEIAKLVKKYLPLTVNGYAVTRIIETAALTAASSEPADSSEPASSSKTATKLNRKEKESVICQHVQRVMAKDPQQPVYLSFMIRILDPDFPFDLDHLSFNLTVPADYPRAAKALPSVVVLNSDIPRGFSVNIERGYRSIANLAKTGVSEEDLKLVDGKGLLSQIQTLVRHLDVFLLQEKRQTMKFVTFKQSSSSPGPSTSPKPKPQQKVDLSAAANEVSGDVTADTLAKRNFYIDEMCQKLSKSVKLFNKSKSESRFKVQLPIVSDKNLPVLWTYRNSSIDIFITVPAGFPQQTARVMIASNFNTNRMVAKKSALEAADFGTPLELMSRARLAESYFAKNVALWSTGKDLSLLNYLNWIANNLSVLVAAPPVFQQWCEQMLRVKESMEN